VGRAHAQDDGQVSTQVAMAELLLSGCTTSSDHLYIYPNGVRLDDSIGAAQANRHALRGHTRQHERGARPGRSAARPRWWSARTVILKDTQRLIEAHHDSAWGAMTQIAVAPCSPFSVSRDLMRESAVLARSYGVRLHTHLAENDHDLAYSREKFNCTPAQYAHDLGWLGRDVWHAHCVKLDEDGISLFAASRTGVAHCPCSNMRLASGIAPVRRMLDAGVPVGLGVDGSASNDAAHLVNEARMALLLARVGRAMQPPEVRGGVRFFGCVLGPAEMTARDVLHVATCGGAQAPGRSGISARCRWACVPSLALFDLGTPGLCWRRGPRPRGRLDAVLQPAGGLHRRQWQGGGAAGAAHHLRAGPAAGAAQPPGHAAGASCALSRRNLHLSIQRSSQRDTPRGMHQLVGVHHANARFRTERRT